MTDVDWNALRDQYRAGYDTGVAELRAAASRFRQSAEVDLRDDELRVALADLFAGLADDAETTGPDPRALSVARSLAALAPRPSLRQVEPARPVPDEPGPEPVPVVATAVAHGRPATRADLVIARVAVAAASVWHRIRRRR
ncbi:hypothetical protein [Cryptosporangium aurantiacum]|uniref:Uncharacterized protein n=1 Tax=Cryptosporangium aurantiacum TaxID=134849 RepID=A0A1M7RI34_9ACTN|nr:hypothetical protein [Cryptosporangium aurantiacum]SHN45819.1 hypothetical protein SAMN05443668_11312 [Cryptosporangium aurantiacum]